MNKSNDSIRIAAASGASFQQFSMDVTKTPFTDVRVRQAIRLLTDRSAIVSAVLAGYGTPGNDLPGKGLKYFASDLVRVRDLEQARYLLARAGQEDLAVTLETGERRIRSRRRCDTICATGEGCRGDGGGQADRSDSVFPYFCRFPQTRVLVHIPRARSISPSLTVWYLTELWRGAACPETHFGDPQDDALLYDAIGERDEAKAADKWHEDLQQIQFDRGGSLSCTLTRITSTATAVTSAAWIPRRRVRTPGSITATRSCKAKIRTTRCALGSLLARLAVTRNELESLASSIPQRTVQVDVTPRGPDRPQERLSRSRRDENAG